MDGFLKIVAVALGGALGSSFRFIIASAIPMFMGRMYLWATLFVNASGSLLIGLAWAFFELHTDLTHWRLFLIVGVLGGFTTYSSFSLEVMNLFQDGNSRTAILYILGTNILAISMAFGGYWGGKQLFA